jgi:hypothetical protein
MMFDDFTPLEALMQNVIVHDASVRDKFKFNRLEAALEATGVAGTPSVAGNHTDT